MLPFRENVEEMLQKNPISVFTNERKTPGIMAEKHWHPCIELQYILEGTAYQNVNETELVLKKGEAILIPSGSVHMTKSLYSECSILVVLFFPEEVFPAISLDVSNTSIIHPLFSLLYEEQKSKNPGFTYISQGLLLADIGNVSQKRSKTSHNIAGK